MTTPIKPTFVPPVTTGTVLVTTSPEHCNDWEGWTESFNEPSVALAYVEEVVPHHTWMVVERIGFTNSKHNLGAFVFSKGWAWSPEFREEAEEEGWVLP